MNIEDMEKIAAGRTSGPWTAWTEEDSDGDGISVQSTSKNCKPPEFIVATTPDVDGLKNGSVILTEGDAMFIAMAAGNIDKLIQIAKIAKSCMNTPSTTMLMVSLVDAVNDLEEEKK